MGNTAQETLNKSVVRWCERSIQSILSLLLPPRGSAAFPVSCRRLSAVLLILGGHLGSGLPSQPPALVIFVTSIQYLRKIIKDFMSDDSVFQIWVSAFGLHTQRYLLREAQSTAWPEHWLKYISDQLRWCWQTERRRLGFCLLICYHDQRKELYLWFRYVSCHKLLSGFTCSKMG